MFIQVLILTNDLDQTQRAKSICFRNKKNSIVSGVYYTYLIRFFADCLIMKKYTFEFRGSKFFALASPNGGSEAYIYSRTLILELFMVRVTNTRYCSHRHKQLDTYCNEDETKIITHTRFLRALRVSQQECQRELQFPHDHMPSYAERISVD